MLRRLIILSLVIALCIVSGGDKVFGISAEQRRLLNSGVRYFDVAESAKAVCTATGPSEVTFPSGMDLNTLETNIKTYITETRPDSPLVNHAKDFVEFGQQYNVNPAMVVGMAQKETSFGITGYGKPPKHNVFNIRGSGVSTGFRTYANYREGIEAIYKQLRGSLYLDPPSNFTTVNQVINRTTPAGDGDNDPNGFAGFVTDVIKKIVGGNNGGGSSTCPSGSGGSGLVNADGYAWPVAPQKKSENGTTEGLSAVPCPNRFCHGDNTGAFDLGRKPGGDSAAGAPLYAISDGHVEMVHIYNGIAGCYSLQLQSSTDKSWYWYGHIQNVSVKDGDTVKAGQQIAEIGIRKCTGNGSTPHLHIDRGCKQGGVFQKGGRDSCRDPDFVPFINRLFGSLPE